MVEHPVNDSYRAALDRALVAEQLDPLDETHDAVCLVADQAGQHPFVFVALSFEELRSASGCPTAGFSIIVRQALRRAP